MTKTEMKKKVAALAGKMDNQWYVIQMEDELDSGSETYWGMKLVYYDIAEVIRILGGSYKRNEDGEHRVLLFGISAVADDIDVTPIIVEDENGNYVWEY